MPIVSLTAERVAALERQIAARQLEADELRTTTELQMWMRELDALRAPLEEYLRERGGDDDGAGLHASGGAAAVSTTTAAPTPAKRKRAVKGKASKTAAKPKRAPRSKT